MPDLKRAGLMVLADVDQRSFKKEYIHTLNHTNTKINSWTWIKTLTGPRPVTATLAQFLHALQFFIIPFQAFLRVQNHQAHAQKTKFEI